MIIIPPYKKRKKGKKVKQNKKGKEEILVRGENMDIQTNIQPCLEIVGCENVDVLDTVLHPSPQGTAAQSDTLLVLYHDVMK